MYKDKDAARVKTVTAIEGNFNTCPSATIVKIKSPGKNTHKNKIRYFFFLFFIGFLFYIFFFLFRHSKPRLAVK